jgi:uncharacterized membrane protein YphA (DoxX/SURF4 family)
MNAKPVVAAWWALRIGLGTAAFLAGLDKYFNILTDWTMYISPVFEGLLPVAPQTFMHIAGAIEIVAGLGLLAGWTRLFGYIVSIWLVCIAINLITTGVFYDVAVRDVEMAIGAWVLARLTEALQGSTVSWARMVPQVHGLTPAHLNH